MIEAIKETHIDHRSYYMCGSKENTFYLSASKDGSISILNNDFNIVKYINSKQKIDDISLDSLNKRFSIIKSGYLSIQDFDENIIFKNERISSFETCYFQSELNLLWVIKRIHNEEIECCVYDAQNWSIISSITIKDDLYCSICTFYSIPKSNWLILSMGAGQDGQGVLWISLKKDKIKYKKEPALIDTTPPVFNMAGSEFLVSDSENIFKYTYPNISLIDTFKFPENVHNRFNHCYLSENYALISSNDDRMDRIYKFDLLNMEINNEIIIKSHKSFIYFERYGNRIIFVYNRNNNWGKDWKDSLLLFDVRQFI